MTDLRERFRALDSLEVPDVMTRVDEMGPSVPAPEPIPIGRRVGTIAFAAVIVVLLILLAVRALPNKAPTPANPEPRPTIDDHALVDVETRDATPLPRSFTNFAGGVGGYEVSPGGTMILFDAATQEDQLHQIYVGNVDGTGIRQVTNEPAGATSGSWSPDGSEIVYTNGFIEASPIAFDEPPLDATLSIVDVESGEARPLVRGLGSLRQHFYEYPTPRFSPDGSTILYTGARKDPQTEPYLATIPAAGGESTIWRESAAWGSYSPDGSKIAFVDTDGYTIAGDPPIEVEEIWIARADGTDARAFVEEEHLADPDWSPDGTKISYTLLPKIGLGTEIVVRDVTTGDARRTATGDATSWLDDDTLIVEDYFASAFTKEPREGPSENADATITFAGSSCELDGVDGPIAPGELTLELVNESHFEVLFQVVRLKAGQTLADLRAGADYYPSFGGERSVVVGPLREKTWSSTPTVTSSWAAICWKDIIQFPNGIQFTRGGIAGPIEVN
jgi:hypothetical protein